MEIAPSLLSANFGNLNREIQDISNAGAKRLHLDVMDGHFVPNLSFGVPVLAQLQVPNSLRLDLHLMVQNPENILPDFLALPAHSVCLHVESTIHLHRHLKTIRQAKKQVAVALNPSTPLSSLDWILEELDFVLIMSVNPGFSGQAFLPSSLNKIEALANRIAKLQIATQIMVDGGVTTKNIKQIANAGATTCVAGASVFNEKDYKQAISNLQQSLK